LASFPIDTAVMIIFIYKYIYIYQKVRLQIYSKNLEGNYKYRGLINTTKIIYKEEGLFSLYKGLVAGF